MDRAAIINLVKVHCCMLVMEICWGAINIWGHLASLYVEANTLSILRAVGSLPFVLVIAIFVDLENFYETLHWKLVLKTCIGVGLPHALMSALYMYALFFSNPVNVSLIWLSITPLTCFFGMALKREQRSIIKVIGVCFAVGGALVTMDLGNYTSHGLSFVGDIMCFIAALCFSFYLLFTDEISGEMNGWTLTIWQFAGHAFFSLFGIPPAWFTVGLTNLYIPNSAWTSLAILIAATSIGYTCTNYAIKHTSPLLIAMYTPVEMIVTVIFAAILLGEQMIWQQGLGALLILIGLALVTWEKYKEHKNENHVADEEIDISTSAQDKGFNESTHLEA